ncbi:MAG TPA: 50S ribosomal protein L4 [Nitrospiria bacterium]
MASIDVINQKGEKLGEVPVDDRFLHFEGNQSVVHEAVVMQLASKRQGTSSTKTKGLVSGGGKKPWRQKGTGRARAGSSRSPIWKGGGTVFGPQPRNYMTSFPKKKMRLALASSLGSKIVDGKVTVMDSFDLPEPKTKLLVQLLKQLGLTGKVLMVTSGRKNQLEKASANLGNVLVMTVNELNVYDLVGSDHLVVLKEDFEVLAGAWI